MNIDYTLASKKINPEVKSAGTTFSFDTLKLKHSASPLLEVVPQVRPAPAAPPPQVADGAPERSHRLRPRSGSG